MADGPVLAPVCQGSRTGGFMARTDPVSCRPAVPAPSMPHPVLMALRSAGHGVLQASDVGASSLSGVCV